MTTSEICFEKANNSIQLERIRVRLKNLTGVYSVEIDENTSKIIIEHNTNVKRNDFESQIRHLGLA